MESVQLTCNGFQIDVVDGGTLNAETVVFAHGLSSCLEQWEPQMKALCDRYRVVAFSLQGHGGSSKPLEADAYTIQSFRDTALAVLEQLGIQKWTWVGNSMGGVIGYACLQVRPQAFRRLITNGTTPVLQYSPLGLKAVEWLDRTMLALMGKGKYVRFAAWQTSEYEGARQSLAELMGQASKEAIIFGHRALGNYDFTELLQQEALPIDIIRCPGDAAINKLLDRSLENGSISPLVTVHEMEKVGHVANLERPEAYTQLLLRLLELA